MWTDFIYGLGDAFQTAFAYLPLVGNSLNYLFILLILGAIIYWFGQLKSFGNK